MASAKCLENEDVDYATSLVSMGLALMCLDVKQNPSRLTTRMVLLNIGLTGAFLFWFYNAIFISYLTVVRFWREIRFCKSHEIEPLKILV